ncbi:MAG: hypothetical protein JEZ11_26905, partial [Desulfobacterales bacterium]|nr:hypothetical protein [Desulfobacterales bacterium]
MNVLGEEKKSDNLGQEELDKLLSDAFPEGGDGVDEEAAGKTDAGNGGGSLNQADLDALLGDGDAGVEAAVEMAEADADPAPEAAPEE